VPAACPTGQRTGGNSGHPGQGDRDADLEAAGSAYAGDDLLSRGSPVPHACHTPGAFTVIGGNSRTNRPTTRAYVGPAYARSGLPTFQAGALASALLTEEPSNGLTMTTWSRMTTEAAKAAVSPAGPKRMILGAGWTGAMTAAGRAGGAGLP
jgi:hypothetical protein